MGLPGLPARPVLPPCRRLGATKVAPPWTGGGGARPRADVPPTAYRTRPSHRPRQPVREPRVPRPEHGRGAACSMSAAGNCYDNAVAESFFATLKKELVHGRAFATRSSGAIPPLATNHPSPSSWRIPLSSRQGHTSDLSGKSGELQYPPTLLRVFGVRTEQRSAHGLAQDVVRLALALALFL